MKKVAKIATMQEDGPPSALLNSNHGVETLSFTHGSSPKHYHHYYACSSYSPTHFSLSMSSFTKLRNGNN